MRPTHRPFVAAGLVALSLAAPALVGPYQLILLTQALVLAIACLSLNLLLGYAGLLSLGHAAYFGLGGYAGALLFTFGDLTSLETRVASGVLASTVLAGIVGFLSTRSRRMHLSIVTLAFGQVIHALSVGGAAFRPFEDTGKGFFLIGHGGLYARRGKLLRNGAVPSHVVELRHQRIWTAGQSLQDRDLR